MRTATPFIFTMLLATWLCMTAAVLADGGPLLVQNRFPLHLLFLTPRPTSALLPPEGELNAALSVDYSSVYVNESSSQWSMLMDMEMTVVALSFTWGLTDRAAVRLDVPLVNMSGGFLDGFLENYHDALGVGNYGREERPQDSFAYHLDRAGETWLEGDSGGLRLADITVSGQWALFALSGATAWHTSVLVSLKLPTGEPAHGYGSGRLDAGLFFPTHYASGLWTLHAMPGFIWHSDPRTSGAEVEARPSISFLIGAGYAYSERWQLLAQLNYFSSPVEKIGIGLLDDGAFELEMGFRYLLERGWQIELAFCEDLFTRAAPDFTVHMGLLRSFAGLNKGR